MKDFNHLQNRSIWFVDNTPLKSIHFFSKFLFLGGTQHVCGQRIACGGCLLPGGLWDGSEVTRFGKLYSLNHLTNQRLNFVI